MTVFYKELADHFTSWRGIILFVMILLMGVLAIIGPSGAIENMRADVTAPTQFVFLRLFTAGSYSFAWRISMILIPIVGIILGLDAINSEKNSGTLSRLLAQPIYRDAVINGKFLAGIVTLAIMLTTTILIIGGIGLLQLGVAPTSEEVARLLLFWGTSILYGAFWLGLAILFSTLFAHVATSALTSIGIWVFFFFYTMTGFIAGQAQNPQAAIIAMRVSPLFLFQESMSVILVPGARTISEMLQLISASDTRFIPGPLSLGQSLLTIWPQLAIIGGLTAALFAGSYIKFMREEIRST
jgi:ABC-2 type transport system permease protein